MPQRIATICTILIALCAGCDDAGESIDLAQGLSDGKTDLTQNSRLVEVAPDTDVVGSFGGASRTIHGYVIDAGVGAEISIDVTAVSPGGGVGLQPQDELDVVMSINAGFESPQQPGERVEGVAGGSTTFEIERKGKYLVTWTTFDDTRDADFDVGIRCEGPDEACRRGPAIACSPGNAARMLVIDGRNLTEGAAVLHECDVVFTTGVTVAPEATLTVGPGVTLHADERVKLDVEGTLEVHGTAQAPVRFVGRGKGRWEGVVLRGQDNLIEGARFTDARNAIHFARDSSGRVADTIVEREGPRNAGPVGIDVRRDANATIERSLVRGYLTGIRIIDANAAVIRDCVIRENTKGFDVIGGNSSGSLRCRGSNLDPMSIVRDPVIDHTDIIHNDDEGLVTRGDDVILQLSKSNVVANGELGIDAQGPQLGEMSFIRDNNISDNNEGSDLQMRSFHSEQRGVIELSGNHWGPLADLQELTERFSAQCGGFFDIKGVAFDPIADAGPRAKGLLDEIRKQTLRGD